MASQVNSAKNLEKINKIDKPLARLYQEKKGEESNQQN